MNPLSRIRWFIERLGTEWKEDRIPDLAAGVAFYAILSLLPTFLALAAVLGLLESLIGGDLASRAETEVVEFLASVLTSEADGTLAAVESLFSDARPGLLTFSLLAALWAMSRGFAALVRALDVVYDIDDHRGFIQIRTTAIILSLGSVIAGAVMLALVIIGPLFGSGQELADEIGLGDQFVFLWESVRWPVVFVLLIAWAATLFHIAPDHHTPWRWDLPGATVTAVGWACISLGFRLYVQVAASGNAVFGALGGVLLVLLWTWLMAVTVLVGGEINEILYDEFGRSRHGAPVRGVRFRPRRDTVPANALATEGRPDSGVTDGSDDEAVESRAESGDEVAGVDG